MELNKPGKVLVIGLDGAVSHLIEKHIAEGHLPAFKKLIGEGVIAENALVPYPTITPPNWTSIATGAWPGTHSVSDFHVKPPGSALKSFEMEAAFSSSRCKS